MNENIIFGREIVLTALQENKKIKKIIFQQSENASAKINKINFLCKEKKINFSFLPKSALNKISPNSNHQGVIAYLENFNYEDLNNFLNKTKTKKNVYLIAVNNLQDPHNLGAIIRSANAFKFDALILPERNNAPINETVHKTSAGYSLNFPIIKINNLANTLEVLKENNFWIYGLKKEGENISNIKWADKICIIVGGEDKALGDLVQKKCDFLVSIPIKNEVNSLNTSVSAAVAMYEAGKYEINQNK